MKTKLLLAMLVTFLLSGCNPKTAAIKNELRLIEKTAKDTKQVDFIRESAEVFANVLSEEQGILRRKLFTAHWDMVCSRNATTIATYVAFLKAIEKKLPDQLPPVEVYEAMKNKAGSSEVVLYNLGQTVIMMSNSIQSITLYNDPAAAAEVEGVLKRLKQKYGTSETSEKIMELLNTVHGHGLQSRARGNKPWESPRKTTGSID